MHKSTQHPHFVFHLSKRHFTEWQVKSAASPLNLNILSSEYMGDVQKFLQRKQRKRDKKAEAKCVKCAQYTSDFDVCKHCSLEMM